MQHEFTDGLYDDDVGQQHQQHQPLQEEEEEKQMIVMPSLRKSASSIALSSPSSSSPSSSSSSSSLSGYAALSLKASTNQSSSVSPLPIRARGTSRELLWNLIRKQAARSLYSASFAAASAATVSSPALEQMLSRLTHLPLDHCRLTHLHALPSVTPSSSSTPSSPSSAAFSTNNAVDFIQHCTAVEVLYLHSNHLHELGSLEFAPSLTHLYLSDNRLTSLHALKSCLKLTQLYANENRLLSLEGVEHCTQLTEIYASCQKRSSSLSSSSSSSPSLSSSSSAPYFELSESLMRCLAPSLRVLDLHGNLLSSSSFHSLAHLFALETLNISRTGCCELAPLLQLLHDCRRLHTLDARENVAVNSRKKYRESLVIASCSTLLLLDDKPIAAQERLFLQRLESRRHSVSSLVSLKDASTSTFHSAAASSSSSAPSSKSLTSSSSVKVSDAKTLIVQEQKEVVILTGRRPRANVKPPLSTSVHVASPSYPLSQKIPSQPQSLSVAPKMSYVSSQRVGLNHATKASPRAPLTSSSSSSKASSASSSSAAVSASPSSTLHAITPTSSASTITAAPTYASSLKRHVQQKPSVVVTSPASNSNAMPLTSQRRKISLMSSTSAKSTSSSATTSSSASPTSSLPSSASSLKHVVSVTNARSSASSRAASPAEDAAPLNREFEHSFHIDIGAITIPSR